MFHFITTLFLSLLIFSLAVSAKPIKSRQISEQEVDFNFLIADVKSSIERDVKAANRFQNLV